MKISSDWSCSLEKGDGKLLTKTWKSAWLCEKIKYKAIEEICGKSTWQGSLSRLADVRVISSKKQKKPFLDKVNGSMCAEFQVYIVFRLARRRDTIHNYTYTSEIRNILDRLLASPRDPPRKTPPQIRRKYSTYKWLGTLTRDICSVHLWCASWMMNYST